MRSAHCIEPQWLVNYILQSTGEKVAKSCLHGLVCEWKISGKNLTIKFAQVLFSPEALIMLKRKDLLTYIRGTEFQAVHGRNEMFVG